MKLPKISFNLFYDESATLQPRGDLVRSLHTAVLFVMSRERELFEDIEEINFDWGNATSIIASRKQMAVVDTDSTKIKIGTEGVVANFLVNVTRKNTRAHTGSIGTITRSFGGYNYDSIQQQIQPDLTKFLEDIKTLQ